MTARTTLLAIGAIFWISALACWWRARGRGRQAGEAVLFVMLGLPFLIAGAFYSASSYPAYESPPPAATPPVSIATASSPPPPTPAPSTPAPQTPEHARAVLAAQRAAVVRYPALGVAGTPFNSAFVTAYRRMQRTEPYYFDDPQWPLRLADEIAGELAPE